MSGRLLTFEDGEIRLAGTLMPGVMESLRVDGKLRFDEQKVDGSSGKKKTPKGFEDCDIVVGLFLCTDAASTCYDKLTRVNGMFRDLDAKANPKILTVANRHLMARGIRQVLFSRLESVETMETDEIRVTLGFMEHNPPIVKLEKAQAKTKTPQEAAQEKAQDKAKDKAQTDKVIVDAS